ncbi:tetratricopeptide repeat protein [Streptomyces sp. NPDC050703]|uniref:tetratricopeptide repeat protein n=1 Tax=Streptomyces sp. NPDC050703 TaxID=3157218 RepID=UPI00341CFF60
MPEETDRPRPARFEQALACFREARELTDPDDAPGVYGVILHDEAETHRSTGDLGRAVGLFRQAVAYQERAGNPSALTTSMAALANVLVAKRETVEARDVLKRLGVEIPKIGAVQPRAVALHNLGLAYEDLGSLGVDEAYSEAVTAHRAVLDLLDGESDPGWYATVLRDLGDAYAAQDLLTLAHASYEEAVRYTRRIGGGRSNSLVTMLIVLGRASRRLGTLEGEVWVDGVGPADAGEGFGAPPVPGAPPLPDAPPPEAESDGVGPADGPPADVEPAGEQA